MGLDLPWIGAGLEITGGFAFTAVFSRLFLWQEAVQRPMVFAGAGYFDGQRRADDANWSKPAVCGAYLRGADGAVLADYL